MMAVHIVLLLLGTSVAAERLAIESRSQGQLFTSALSRLTAPDIGRRGAETPAECTIEMRKIAKARVEGKCADRFAVIACIGQPTAHLGQALRQHEVGKAHAYLLEKFVHVSRRNAVAGGDSRRAQRAVAEILQHVGLNGAQAGRADPRNLRGSIRCSPP